MNNHSSTSKKVSIYEQQQVLKYGLNLDDFIKKNEMPVEYFTGKVDFAGLTLAVNKQVLIPRIETEELVDRALLILRSQEKQVVKIIDLATGSGAIALALIKQLSLNNYFNRRWEFYLIDVSSQAIKLAKKNYQDLIAQLNCSEQIKATFIVSNLFEKLDNNLQCDLLLANLPYIPSAKIQNLPASVKKYEPLIALDGGRTGFELIAKALEQVSSSNLLAKDAILLFETDSSHDLQFVNKNFPTLLQKFEFQFIKDQFFRQRFIQVKKL